MKKRTVRRLVDTRPVRTKYMVIESNIPLPPRSAGGSGPASLTTQTARKLKIGQSFLVPGSNYRPGVGPTTSCFSSCRGYEHMRFAQRKEGDDFRIFRIEDRGSLPPGPGSVPLRSAIRRGETIRVS